MKKLLLILLFIVFMAQPVLGAFTRSIDTRRTYKNAYRWTGKPRDFILTWAAEAEDRLTGATAIEFLFLDPTDTEPGTSKGMFYMDESESKLRYYNGGSWITIESGSAGNSLDGAYDVGRSISVDGGSVILTATDAADNVVLALIQSDTGSVVGQTITSAGTGALLTFDSNGTGADILGSDSTWTFTKAGALSCVGITSTAGDVLFDDTFDLFWDTSKDLLLFNDSAILGFGGASGDNADISVTFTTPHLLIEAASQDSGIIKLGATNSLDFNIYGNTNTDIASFDAGAGMLLLDSYPIALGDGDAILYGDTLGTGDFSVSSTSAVLAYAQVAADTGEITYGASGTDIPIKWFAEATSDWVYFNADEVEFEDVVLQMMDATQIQFGDSDDFFMHATGTAFTFGSLTSDESGIYSFGADTDGDDIKMFGGTTGEYWLWDAGADSILPVCGNALYTLTDAEADQFKVNATGATSDAVAINFETTDGKILLNADGGTGGDIELNAADDLIFTTAGKVTITNGSEAMTVSGAATVAGIFTANGTIVGDGATTLTGTKATVETYIAAGRTITIADSGTVFENTGDADGTLLTLPEASTAKGCSYTFVVTETGQQIIVELDNADVFLHLTLGAGDQIQSSTLGDTITVMAVSDSQWAVISVYPLAADWADGGA